MQLSLWFIVCFWPQVWTCPAPWVMSLHTKRSRACWFAGALHMLVFQSKYAYNTFSVYVYIYIHIVMCIMYVMCKYIFCRHNMLPRRISQYVPYSDVRARLDWFDASRIKAGLTAEPDICVIDLKVGAFPFARPHDTLEEMLLLIVEFSLGWRWISFSSYFWTAVNLHLVCWISCEAEREKYAKLMLLICTDGVAWQSFWTAALGFSCNRALGSSSSLQEVSVMSHTRV